MSKVNEYDMDSLDYKLEAIEIIKKAIELATIELSTIESQLYSIGEELQIAKMGEQALTIRIAELRSALKELEQKDDN